MTHKRFVLTGLTALTLAAAAALTPSQASAVVTASVTTDAQTTKVVAAANAFLGTLTAAQKKTVSYAYNGAAQRAKWSNFPTGIFQRTGLRWGDLSAKQRTALTTLLGTILSADGLKMVQQQMDADEVLKNTDGGRGLVFGSAEYYVAFLGTPSATSPWTLQFGGHHLAINATVVGSNITLAPSLTGGQPVKYTLNGKAVYIVEKEVKDAFAMVGGLTAAQQAKAVISTQNIDLVLGPGQDGKTLQPEGLPGSALSAAQKTQLLALIKDRLGALNAGDLASKLAAIQKNLDKTYFAWYGPITAGSVAYYRVTGPTVVIEFSPQSMGGDPTNHIHSMYRDPTNDYGAAWTK
ncbi:DUF3500 domain-containing protein [Deinococcus oregonensis]|uniref:DUF3500 domain-containing protein n=1 Tax=Deinococcus oregonensis TaxID=1805970 RepID=A0ABV6AXJ2_9DEIO